MELADNPSRQSRWYRNFFGFFAVCVLSTAIAVLVFFLLVSGYVAFSERNFSLIGFGFVTAITFGFMFAIPAPLFAIIFGYPIWLVLVPLLETRGWSHRLVIGVSSTVVAIVASLGYATLLGFWKHGFALNWEMLRLFALIALSGVIGTNLAARWFYIAAK